MCDCLSEDKIVDRIVGESLFHYSTEINKRNGEGFS